MIYHCYLNERKLENVICLFVPYKTKKNYFAHIRPLKQVLNYELILKKVHSAIQFNQEAWLKPYIDMNTKLRKEAKNDF